VSGILVDGSDNHIVDNTVTDSTRGIDVDGTGNLIVRNSVSGATVAYAINAGNAFGPLIVVTGDGDISNTAGSGHPQANFTY
jgi:parallel beta-helix repeat protein